jgi:hypothetical protein
MNIFKHLAMVARWLLMVAQLQKPHGCSTVAHAILPPRNPLKSFMSNH